MRKLKYLRLFEAFESAKLTKTLGYVDGPGKTELVNRLRRICDKIDYPFSQLNDSHFQYLPFQKALDLQYVSEDTPCKATSKSEFGTHGIEGETCKEGRIKRMWGTRQRVVECPHCGGTGIEPEKSEIKMIKFWFNKEGHFITMTALDNTSTPKVKKKNINFSQKVSDYNLGDNMTSDSDISGLNHGDYVYAQLTRSGEPIICYVYKERYRTYLIQNEHDDGDYPNNRNWKDIAQYSWDISSLDFVSMRKAELKNKNNEIEIEEEEIDPISFNRPISFNYRGEPQLDRYKSDRTLEQELNKAHFALIFNIESLKKSEFKTKEEIKSERDVLKSGSRLVVKDEDIKKANIQRYMNEIAKRNDIVSDVSNLPKVVKRIVGGENVLFLMCFSSSFLRNLSNLADYYVLALKEVELGEGDRYQNRLSDLITRRYRTISDDNSEISRNLKEVKEYCLKSNFNEEYQIVEGLQKISSKIYQMISNSKLECVEDIDIIYSKLESIRMIFKNSRYKLENLDYFIDGLMSSNSESAKRYLTNHSYVRDNKSEILTGIDMFIKVLDRY